MSRMSRILALVLMCALLPRWALAQGTSTPLPPDDSLVAPPLVPAPEQVEPEDSEPVATTPSPGRGQPREERAVSNANRLILETLSGGAGTVVGGLGGLVLGITATDCDLLESDCTEAVIFVTSGIALGTALATWGAGSLMNGRGGFMGTLLGTLLGMGGGVLAVAADRGGTLGAIALLSLPAIGAVTGFELSRHVGAETPTRFSLTGASVPVAPTFGTTPHGGFMGGVAGRF